MDDYNGIIYGIFIWIILDKQKSMGLTKDNFG